MSETIRQQIEEESFAACKKQKVAHKKAGIAERWTAPEEDCYEMGFETGAMWAMRWWAERFMQRKTSYVYTQPDHIFEELEQAAKEILGGEK